MDNFYRWLLSTSWAERLRAYAYIEKDLRHQKRWVMNDDKWEDMKMLVGQIISIHFKKYPAKDVKDFSQRLTRLYQLLLAPMSEEKSRNHVISKNLLMDIYDEDDIAARQTINQYFHQKRLKESHSVLDNLFWCYEYMMDQVMTRYLAVMA
ncbi:MAG: hypothetical protein IIT82_02085 [Selenomonas sp.]|uniref:hypothetical protein n=1 Tax=Selenomonas sp. AE3005 TaxID=1485543 RepID=UPI0012DFB6B5|nr:hypothetical protein [Selenomonas sp. AE3005]MBQ1417104.1 hypothetical protein [Selenomonas sp.]MBQ1462141.1 hypothetical protein [Selenomonas sp.]MBQ1613296.1 hypothetical protein [Selenomonas sp.]MBQ2087909.1 hypothetical protein [Selenomonas sp.]MBQ4212811.1 hypothetical protein [Selenomonas sp.]